MAFRSFRAQNSNTSTRARTTLTEKGPGEEGPEDIPGQRMHMQENQMELELQRASSIPFLDGGAVQEQLGGHINDAKSGRHNSTRQPSEKTSYESDEPPQTD